MSRAAFVFLFLLTIPHAVEALASGQEAPMRPMLICENHTRSIDALDLRDCIERPKPQKRSLVDPHPRLSSGSPSTLPAASPHLTRQPRSSTRQYASAH